MDPQGSILTNYSIMIMESVENARVMYFYVSLTLKVRGGTKLTQFN